MKATGFRARLREYKSLTEAQRKAIFKRDNYTCQTPGCGRKISLEVHHIRGEDIDLLIEDYNHPFNLITVCRDCHNGLTNLEINHLPLYIAYVQHPLQSVALKNRRCFKPLEVIAK